MQMNILDQVLKKQAKAKAFYSISKLEFWCHSSHATTKLEAELW